MSQPISPDDSCLIELNLESHIILKLKRKAQKKNVSLNDFILSLIDEAVSEDGSIIDMVGANKNSGLYASNDDVDQFVLDLRDEWEEG